MMNFKIDILKDDARYGKIDLIIDFLFCVSSVIFAFAIPFQFKFTPWIAHWFFAVIIFKLYYVLRGKESLISINIKDSLAIFSLGFYGVWALLSSYWSLHPEVSHKFAVSWLSSLLIIPGIYILSCKRLPITLMMKAFVCGCTALIIYSLTDLTNTALDGDIRFYIQPRMAIMNHIASITYHHIYLGFIIAVSLFISSKFIFSSKTSVFEKVYFAIHSVFALFLLAIDNSRIVTFALFLSIFVFFICQLNKNKKLALTIFVFFITLSLTFIVLPTRLGETVLEILENGETNDPRFYIWKSIFTGLKEVPFLGYGYAAVDEIYEKIYLKSDCWFAANNHFSTHNQVLESFFSLGYLGVILNFCFILGMVLIIKKNKSILSASMLILLLVTMTFEVPFCHCFAIPLLISWFTFCHSGKTDMNVTLPKYTFLLPVTIVLFFAGNIAFLSYKSINKYSSKKKVEVSDFSKRKFTQKNLKKNKITEDNIDMIVCKGETGSIYTQKDYALDIRDYAYINSTDTVVFSVDYYISKDFGAEKIVLGAQRLSNKYVTVEKKLKLKDREIWKSDTLIIKPSCIKITHNNTNQIEFIHTKNTDTKVFVQTELHNAKTFNDLKGYALFRNMKIEPLHNKRNDNDTKK